MTRDVNADNELSFPYPQYVRKEGYVVLMTQHHSASSQKQENCFFLSDQYNKSIYVNDQDRTGHKQIKVSPNAKQ